MSSQSPQNLREEIHKVRDKADYRLVVNFTVGNYAEGYEEMVTEQVTPAYEALRDCIIGEANRNFIYDSLHSEGFG